MPGSLKAEETVWVPKRGSFLDQENKYQLYKGKKYIYIYIYINRLFDIYKQGLFKIKLRIFIHGVTSFETLKFYM